ncbi:type II toxin-antitoxin system death-on-curing family toxin [Desulfobulbus sp. F5]|nr:type II toxin-antitoxin system death-on-curing family toxin [Desulfobulbus sp. F5]
MRYLRLSEVLYLHDCILKESGGRHGVRNQGGLESALALPRQTFGEIELYPSIVEKAAILCFSLVNNHPFIDGNKRVAHAAMEIFLIRNGMELFADIDEQEQAMLHLASSSMSHEEFIAWLVNKASHRKSK